MQIPFVQEYLNRKSTRLKRLQLTVGMGGYNNFVGADNAGVNAISSAAQPYVITINNTSRGAVDVNNFTIFNGNAIGNNTQINPVNFPYGNFTANGNYTFNGVVVSSGIGGVSYQALVNQSQSQPFNVGTTVIVANNDVVAQIQQSIISSTTDANGLTQGVPVPLLKDPFQSQKDMIVCDTPYQIDGTAALTITTVLAGANFSIYFYPSQNISPTNTLAGQSSLVDCKKPDLIRTHSMTIAK